MTNVMHELRAATSRVFGSSQNTASIQPPTMPPKARQNSRNLIEQERDDPTSNISFKKARYPQYC